MWAALAGALGLGQALIQNDQANKAKDLEAQTQKWSPWTHMQAAHAQNANPLGTILGGVTSGLGMDQAQQNSDVFNKWLLSQTKGAAPASMSNLASTDSPELLSLMGG